MKLEHAVSVSDVRELARRRLPRMIFNFVEGGAEDEVTFRANEATFEGIEFQPNALVDVSSRDLSTSIRGRRLSAPLVLAPAGLTRAVHPEGELAVARAAATHGVPYVISAWSTYTIEELAETGADMWYETGPASDDELRTSLIKRVAASNYSVLFYMADAPVGGRRERELRHGIGFPPRYSMRNILDGLLHPRWGIGWVQSAHNVAPRSIEGAGGARSLLPKVPANLPFGKRIGSPSGTWDDVRRVRDQWDGPFGVKGIITAEDAVRSIDAGADIVVVSNHGGRQLDGVPATVSVLSEVVAAVDGRADVLIDGGVRRGTHIAKALGLGAKACMIGRPYHYGLGAAGEAGVDKVIAMLKDELDRTLGLLGRPTIGDVDASILRPSTVRALRGGPA